MVLTGWSVGMETFVSLLQWDDGDTHVFFIRNVFIKWVVLNIIFTCYCCNCCNCYLFFLNIFQSRFQCIFLLQCRSEFFKLEILHRTKCLLYGSEIFLIKIYVLADDRGEIDYQNIPFCALELYVIHIGRGLECCYHLSSSVTPSVTIWSGSGPLNVPLGPLNVSGGPTKCTFK